MSKVFFMGFSTLMYYAILHNAGQNISLKKKENTNVLEN